MVNKIMKVGVVKTSIDLKSRVAKEESFLLQMPASFLIGFFCIYVKTFAMMTPLFSFPDALDRGLLLIGALFLCIHILLNLEKYSGRAVTLLLVLLACAYSYIASGETSALVVALVIIAAATAGDAKSLLRVWLGMTLFLTLFLIAVFLLTAIFEPDQLTYTVRGENGGAILTRFNLSFSHPNMAAAIIMMLCGVFMFLNYENLNIRTYSGVIVISVLVLLLTNSRTSFVLTLIEILLFAAQKQRAIFNLHWIRNIVALMPAIFFLAVFLVSGPLYSDFMSDLFTGRISLWHQCFLNQGITFFGQPFQSTSYTNSMGWTYYYTTLDSAYALGLFVLGLIFSIFFCWSIFALIKRADSSLGMKLPLIIVMLLFGFTEAHVFNIVVCAPLLLLAEGILPVKTNERIKASSKARHSIRRLKKQRSKNL